jgi:cAMP-dependent protein kinase regulator
MEVFDKLVNLMPSLPGAGGVQLEVKVRRQRMRNVFAAPIEMAKDFAAPLVPENEEQIEFLEHALKDNFIIGSMQSNELRTLVNAMALNSVKEGTEMIHQGDRGDYLYVLQSGTVKFIVDGVEVGEASSSGTVIGDLALLYDCPRAATVVAITDCKVWRVSQHVFRRIKAAYALQNDHETRSALRKLSFFQDLPQEYIHILADSMFVRNFQQGEVLIRKGEEGETLFIITEGYVAATDISIGGTKYADLSLGPGDYFGERPIVMGTPNAATVTAATDGKAWFLTKERFLGTLGHLNLNELIRKSQERKILVSASAGSEVATPLGVKITTVSSLIFMLFRSFVPRW